MVVLAILYLILTITVLVFAIFLVYDAKCRDMKFTVSTLNWINRKFFKSQT